MSVRSIPAIGAAVTVASLAWCSAAAAQTAVTQPTQPGPSAPAPPPQTVTTTAPGVATPAPESVTHTSWRPDRGLLMTGLVLFGVPYIASVGIAGTSSRAPDGNLAVPVIGPWLDLGGRRGCPGGTSCGAETGYQVLLAADGILQAIGAFEIVGAFVFPETREVTTLATSRNTSVTLSPSRVAPGAYGLAAVGDF